MVAQSLCTIRLAHTSDKRIVPCKQVGVASRGRKTKTCFGPGAISTRRRRQFEPAPTVYAATLPNTDFILAVLMGTYGQTQDLPVDNAAVVGTSSGVQALTRYAVHGLDSILKIVSM